MTDVFISYSRKDIAFARILHEALAENDLETWIDWQNIPPSADWLTEVYEAIEQADCFIFIISETSVISEVCNLEISHAAKHNKRLIPIVVNEIEPSKVPVPLAALNWIFFQEGDHLSKPLEKLIEALKVDHDWVKEHTRYLNRALEWERQGHENSRLLRGNDLIQAEMWSADSAGKDPAPTALHIAYIAASRRSATGRQRLTLVALLGVLAVSVGLAISAWVMRNTAIQDEHVRATAESQAIAEALVRATAEAAAVADVQVRATAQIEAEAQREIAEDQRDKAISRKLAAQAINGLDHLDLSLLLAVESSLIADTRETRSALLSGLLHHPQLDQIHYTNYPADVCNLAFSPDGSRMAVLHCDDTILLWDWEQQNPIGDPILLPESGIADIALSSGGEAVYAWKGMETLIRWEVSSGQWSTLIDHGKTPDQQAIDLFLISPSTEFIATAKESGMRIWQTKDMQPASEGLTYSDWNITAMSFSQDENIIAVGYQHISENQAAILIVDTQTGKILEGPLPMDEQARRITHLVFHPDGSILVIGVDHLRSDGSTLSSNREWDRNAGDWLTIGFPKEKEYKLQYSPDGEHLAVMYSTFVSGEVPTINLIPANGGIVFTPDSQNLITGGPNGTLYTWSLEKRDGILQRPLQNNQSCSDTAFSPDGRFLVGDCYVRGVVLWDVSTGEEIARHEQVIVDKRNSAQSIAFSPNGERIATGYDWGLVALWDASSLELIGELLQENTLTITGLAFSPDSRWLAAGSASKHQANDPTLVIFRAEDGVKVMSFNADTFWKVDDLAWSPLSDRLILGGMSDTPLETKPVTHEPGALESGAFTFGGTIRPGTFWYIDSLSTALEAENPDLAEIRTVLQAELWKNLSLTPDGKYILAASNLDHHIQFYRLDTMQADGLPLAGQKASIDALAFDSTGHYFASGSKGSSASKNQTTLWDLASRLALTPPIPVGATSLDFNPQGTLLAIEAELWEMSLEAWQRFACQIANRDLTREEWTDYLGDRPYAPACPRILQQER